MQILLEGDGFDVKIYPHKKVIYYRRYNMTAYGLLYFDEDPDIEVKRLYQDWQEKPIPEEVEDLLAKHGYLFF